MGPKEESPAPLIETEAVGIGQAEESDQGVEATGT